MGQNTRNWRLLYLLDVRKSLPDSAPEIRFIIDDAVFADPRHFLAFVAASILGLLAIYLHG